MICGYFPKLVDGVQVPTRGRYGFLGGPELSLVSISDLYIFHFFTVNTIIAILCIFPLIFFCDNFSYHATHLR